jgi:site-specific DNA-cytosine methylase
MAFTKPKATLELFSGTGSFTKVASVMLSGTHAAFLTLDNDSFFEDSTTFVCDILDFKYMAKLSPFCVTHVWASCPCTEYSIARSKAKIPRDLAGADRLVKETLDIIDWIQEYNNPDVTFYIENPSHSLLKTRPVLKERHYPFYDVTYCRYAPEWGLRKATRVYSNVSTDRFVPKRCMHGRQVL